MSGVQTVKRAGSRFYVHPERPQITVPGVTSVIDMAPKGFLPYWYAKMAAECALRDHDFIGSMIEREDEVAAVNHVKGAAQRYTNSRAKVGSEFHDLAERMIRGERVLRVSPDLEPYRRHFADFLDTVQPELISAEDVVWSDTHEYAGSSDAILAVKLNEDHALDPTGEAVTLMTDWKTSKDLHEVVALQLAAYANANRIIDSNGTSRAMPEINGGAALHITPAGYEFRVIDIGDDVFDAFLALRRVFTWERETSRGVIGRALASSTDRLVTGTQRRG